MHGHTNPTMCRTAPATKKYPDQNVSSTEVEELYWSCSYSNAIKQLKANSPHP